MEMKQNGGKMDKHRFWELIESFWEIELRNRFIANGVS